MTYKLLESEADYNPTAQRILNVAAHLFMQLGYRAVSISDIVKAAGITKPTLYYYFPDKAELFTQMALQKLAGMHTAINRALAGVSGMDAQLVTLAQALLDNSDGDMRMLRHEMAEHLDRPHQERLGLAFWQHIVTPIHEVMRQGVARGELTGYSAGELTMLFLGLVEAFHGFAGQIGGLHMPPQLGRFRPSVFAAASLVHMFLNGVANNAEREGATE